MRNQKVNINITKRSLVESLAGLTFSMAPGFLPRNFDKIIFFIKKKFNTLENADNYWMKFEGTHFELEKLLKNFLMQCPEFRQLNLSQKDYDKGLREPTSGFIATCVGHDDNGNIVSIEEPEEYSDFIDLDALCGNLAGTLIFNAQASEWSCWLCKNAKSYDKRTRKPTNFSRGMNCACS